MSKRTRPICPRCDNAAKATDTRFGVRYSCCGLWAWGSHPLVDEATHMARQRAHAAFDPIWKSGRETRGAAYAKLAEALNMSTRDCHMKRMDYETARRVPEAVKAIWG